MLTRCGKRWRGTLMPLAGHLPLLPGGQAETGVSLPVPTEPTPTAVREWAKSQGIEVKDRGRAPAELVVKFKAATGQ